MIKSSALRFFGSSIGLKQVVAVTGLALCGFLVSHMAGNFLIIVSKDAFNAYAHGLTSNPLIYVAEAILGAIFLLHLAIALKLAWANRQARPEKYAVKRKTGRGTTFASNTMPYTGALLLIYVVLHLLDMKFGTYYETTLDGETVRDLHRTTMEFFSSFKNMAIYVFAMVVAGIHTSHGFGSAFQSLGANHPKYFQIIQCTSKAYGAFIAIGFSAIAIWAYLQGA